MGEVVSKEQIEELRKLLGKIDPTTSLVTGSNHQSVLAEIRILKSQMRYLIMILLGD